MVRPEAVQLQPQRGHAKGYTGLARLQGNDTGLLRTLEASLVETTYKHLQSEHCGLLATKHSSLWNGHPLGLRSEAGELGWSRGARNGKHLPPSLPA